MQATRKRYYPWYNGICREGFKREAIDSYKLINKASLPVSGLSDPTQYSFADIENNSSPG